MVRFSWHVEDGLQAYLPPGAYSVQKENNVRHAACEIELPQSKDTLEAVLTLPQNYLEADKVKSIGIVLGHGSDAAEWKGRVLTEVAVALASNGYVVMRYFCPQKEQRQQRMFEKALDACATSPYARGVSKWVLGGLGSGGRVAAVVGGCCRGDIAGFVMLSYPLKEHVLQPTAKPRRGEDDLPPPPKSSESPLLGLEKPLLFLLGDNDEFCSPADLREVVGRMQAPDVRVELFEDADQGFKSSSQGKGPAMSVLRRLSGCVLDFVGALGDGNLAYSKLTKAADLPGGASTEAQPPQSTAAELQPEARAVGLSEGRQGAGAVPANGLGDGSNGLEQKHLPDQGAPQTGSEARAVASQDQTNGMGAPMPRTEPTPVVLPQLHQHLRGTAEITPQPKQTPAAVTAHQPQAMGQWAGRLQHFSQQTAQAPPVPQHMMLQQMLSRGMAAPVGQQQIDATRRSAAAVHPEATALEGNGHPPSQQYDPGSQGQDDRFAHNGWQQQGP